MVNQRRSSILCPNCRKLISVDEERCPYCGTRNPGSRWKNNLWTRGFRNTDQYIKAIIYVNIAMYVFSILLDPLSVGHSANPLAFLSPSNKSLFFLGATGTIPVARFHRWWTIVSANYLHGGIIHILFNMIALKQLAPVVLNEYGAYRMVSIYTLGGIVGYLMSYVAGVPLTIGASAAICSLIGAIIYYGKSRGGAYGQALYRQVGAWAIGIFVFGLLVPGINNWAHGGGILAGAVLGIALGYQGKRRENLFHKLLAGICVAVTLAVLCWAVVSAIAYRLL